MSFLCGVIGLIENGGISRANMESPQFGISTSQTSCVWFTPLRWSVMFGAKKREFLAQNKCPKGTRPWCQWFVAKELARFPSQRTSQLQITRAFPSSTFRTLRFKNQNRPHWVFVLQSDALGRGRSVSCLNTEKQYRLRLRLHISGDNYKAGTIQIIFYTDYRNIIHCNHCSSLLDRLLYPFELRRQLHLLLVQACWCMHYWLLVPNQLLHHLLPKMERCHRYHCTWPPRLMMHNRFACWAGTKLISMQLGRIASGRSDVENCGEVFNDFDNFVYVEFWCCNVFTYESKQIAGPRWLILCLAAPVFILRHPRAA